MCEQVRCTLLHKVRKQTYFSNSLLICNLAVTSHRPDGLRESANITASLSVETSVSISELTVADVAL